MNRSQGPKQKRVLLAALVVACLGIWGYVLYQMGSGMDEEAALLPASMTALTPAERRVPVPAPARGHATYDSSFRDPFVRPAALFAEEPAEPSEESEPEEPVIIPPPVTLSGIVGETALLRHESGSAHIARAGEEVAGVRLLAVRRDHIVVRFEDHAHTLRLKR